METIHLFILQVFGFNTAMTHLRHLAAETVSAEGGATHGARDHAIPADQLDEHAIHFRALIDLRRLGDPGDAASGRWR